MIFGGKIHARRCPRGPRGRGRAPDPRGHPVRRLTLFFCRKKANFMRKIWAKDSPQSELGVSGYKRNGEGAETENRERQRDRSNLGGDLAPPTPWWPWTRGQTLLPFREKVKEEEEEEEGGLSPPCFRWRRNAAGGHHYKKKRHPWHFGPNEFFSVIHMTLLWR